MGFIVLLINGVILSEAGKLKQFSREVEESVLFFGGIRILRLAALAQDDSAELYDKLKFELHQ